MQIAINNDNIKKIIQKLQHSSDDIYSYPLQKGYQNKLNVFQDQSNPIFMHAAIFSHLLETSRKEKKKEEGEEAGIEKEEEKEEMEDTLLSLKEEDKA